MTSMTMYFYEWLFMTMFDHVWLCMTMFDYVWLCFTMNEYVWFCIRGRQKERERARAILKLFHPFANFFKLLKIFKQFRLFHMIQMFLNFWYFSSNLDFVYLHLPLLTFVYLCSSDASMHKFCACFFFFFFFFSFLRRLLFS